jgi:hypothetical protein
MIARGRPTPFSGVWGEEKPYNNPPWAFISRDVYFQWLIAGTKCRFTSFEKQAIAGKVTPLADCRAKVYAGAGSLSAYANALLAS